MEGRMRPQKKMGTGGCFPCPLLRVINKCAEAVRLRAYRGCGACRSPFPGKPLARGSRCFFDAADNGGIGAVFVGLHGGKRRFGLLGGHDANHFAFVGNLEHVVAEHVARATYHVFHGNVVFRDHHVNAALRTQFVERRGQAAAGGVAEAARIGGGGEYVAIRPFRGAASLSIGALNERFSRWLMMQMP